jgi:hypothetical protein
MKSGFSPCSFSFSQLFVLSSIYSFWLPLLVSPNFTTKRQGRIHKTSTQSALRSTKIIGLCYSIFIYFLFFFVDCCLSPCSFSLSQLIVLSSIYSFWLPLLVSPNFCYGVSHCIADKRQEFVLDTSIYVNKLKKKHEKSTNPLQDK